MVKKLKTAKHLERHFKGVANHRRIEMLDLIAAEPGISLDGISERLQCNFRTISEHAKKLAVAGLIDKKYQGRIVTHQLSPYGKIFHTFIRTFRTL